MICDCAINDKCKINNFTYCAFIKNALYLLIAERLKIRMKQKTNSGRATTRKSGELLAFLAGAGFFKMKG